jgi:iron complex outermembrane receptor protein
VSHKEINGILVPKNQMLNSPKAGWITISGTTFSVNYIKEPEVDFIAGGGYNHYEGKHFGSIFYGRKCNFA